MDRETMQRLALDPTTPAHVLNEIATHRIDLHPTIAGHPRADEALLRRLRTSPHPGTRPILEARAAGTRPAPQPPQPARPQQPARPPVAPPTVAPAATPAPAAAAPAASSRAPRKRRGAGSSALIALVSGLATVALLAGGGYLWVRSQPATAATHTPAPTNFRIVDVSLVGDGFTMRPLYDDAGRLARIENTLVTSFVGEAGETLVGLSSDGQYPQWISPVPEGHGVAGCIPRGDQIVCDGFVVDVDGSLQLAGPEEAESSEDTQATTGTSAPSSESPEASAPERPAGGRGVAVTAQPSGEMPLTVVSGELRAPGGAAFSASEGVDPVVQLAAERPVLAEHRAIPDRLLGATLPTSRDWFAVTDGTQVLGIEGDEIQWRQDLGHEAPSLGGDSAETSWWVTDDVVIVAEPGKLLGLDLFTGEPAWTIEREFDSWAVDGDELLLSGGGVIVRAELPDPVEGPRDASSEAQGSGGNVEITAPEPQPLPDATILGNTTLDLPPQCASFMADVASFPPPWTFTNGEAHAPELYAVLKIVEAHPTILDGVPVTIARLLCHGGGAYGYESLAVYDRDLQLIGSWEPWGDDSEDMMGGVIWDSYFGESVEVQGNLVRLQVLHVQLPGDDSCHACIKSGTMDFELRWDGSGFTPDRTVLHTPGGSYGSPNLRELQAFYDRVAHRDDEGARALVPSWTPGEIDTEWTSHDEENQGLGFTSRDIHFPVGGIIEGCTMSRPSDYEMTLIVDGVKKPFYGGAFHDEPGYFMCGINASEAENAQEGADSPDGYGIWLEVLTDGEGNLTSVDPGRAFS